MVSLQLGHLCLWSLQASKQQGRKQQIPETGKTVAAPTDLSDCSKKLPSSQNFGTLLYCCSTRFTAKLTGKEEEYYRNDYGPISNAVFHNSRHLLEGGILREMFLEK